ncbi:TonB-dependent receptor [Neoasaia chiangmaiensis NBRC 101099]|nr:TonB-dependent receptor [Neoasaia chiangmaiensis]GBR36199.1 TonB-dependent receptor [Neoasaia chiangmaiensis NBRC 101099]GEN15437.1 hypothetical protein NCH01_18680 [Neoasaia chiangmaiensis]
MRPSLLGATVLAAFTTAQAQTTTSTHKHTNRHTTHHPATSGTAPANKNAGPANASAALAPTAQASTSIGSVSGGSESIQVRAMRRLLREKDSPSAVTEIGAAQIRQTGATGSVVSLLRNAPSVYVYQQGLGNNEPVMSIRGARGSETASTLDGVPMQDLLNGGAGGYLQNIAGGPFNMTQINGVSLYPGVAYPDHNTFGTIGGTVAYTTARPNDKRQLDVFGAVGNYNTWQEGMRADTGQMDGMLGHGVDAPKLMVQYDNMQNSGYIEHTPSRYNSFEGAFDKPYDEGQSLFQATAIYNTGNALITPEPIPMSYLQKYGKYYNFPTDLESTRQKNDYFTLILKNETYINDYLTAGLTGFWRYSDSTTSQWSDPSIYPINGGTTPYTLNGANPFNQSAASFGEQSYYMPASDPYGGGYFYSPTMYPYNGNAQYNNTGNCPSSLVQAWHNAGSATPCGYNSYVSYTHNDTIGIQPRLSITPPDIFGIRNTIHIGGLFARETQNATPTWYGGDKYVPRTAENLVSGYNGGTQRTIFMGYFQDKIDLLHNTLHITPGVTVQGTNSSITGSGIVGGTPTAADMATAYCQQYSCGVGHYHARKWDENYLPFVNATYDLDKVLPALRGVSLYGSFGESALYAPVTDFTPQAVSAEPPNASIVHMAEGGVKYNTGRWAVSADYYYQKIDHDFGYFSYQSGPYAGLSDYNNLGKRQMQGQEVSVTYQMTHEWQLFGNFSHNRSRYLATNPASVTVQEDQFGLAQRGTPVTGVPQWTAQFGVDYHHRSAFTPHDDLNIRFQGYYTGHQYTTTDVGGLYSNLGPISAARGAYGTYNYYNFVTGQTVFDRNGGIAPYVIFNLDMNYTLPIKNLGPLKKLNFDINIQNLFNTFYWQYKYRQITPGSCGKFTGTPAGFSNAGLPSGSSSWAGLAKSNYGCGSLFADGLAGQPATVLFTMHATF